jgi:GntR family transcriptional regulator
LTKLTSKSLSTQIKENISAKINEYDYMSQLPSEPKLASEFGVSRNTIREALKALENEGLIVSRHGIGTFVTRYKNHGKMRYNIATLESTTKIIENHGYIPGTKEVYFDIRTASEEISKKLGSKIPVEVLYIERVRTANDVPTVFVENYIPYEDGMLEDYTRNKYDSIFIFLEKYNPISFASCSINSILSDEQLNKKLSLNQQIALLLLQQVHYSVKSKPVYYSNSYFITDKLEFNLIRRHSK